MMKVSLCLGPTERGDSDTAETCEYHHRNRECRYETGQICLDFLNFSFELYSCSSALEWFRS